jgi:hypothetical protein
VCVASNWSSTDQSLMRIAGCLECNVNDFNNILTNA